MKGFSIRQQNEVIGYAETYRKAAEVADYWTKRQGQEAVVESPNGTIVYHGKGGEND